METLTAKPRLLSTRRLTLISSFCMLMLPMVVMADVCTFEKTVEFTVPTTAVTQLHITAGTGSLDVLADATTDTIRVTGTLCASRTDELPDMSVAHALAGETLQIVTLIPEIRSAFWINHRPYIDLQVHLPAGLPVSIEDTSGDLHVQGTGDLSIIDKSGDINVSAIAGNVVIHDRSGDLTVADVDGRVDINDGSGDIRVQDVSLQAVIHEDGSGDVDLRSVNTSVATGFAGGER